MTTHPFTPEYIAMAKAAEEIQAMRKHSPADNPRHSDYKTGDWYIEHLAGEAVCIGESFLYDEGSLCQAEYSGEEEYPVAWLPRLDQLLGMLGDPRQFVYTAYEGPYVLAGADWHEIALAVVMREKHGKQWRDGAWVKV